LRRFRAGSVDLRLKLWERDVARRNVKSGLLERRADPLRNVCAVCAKVAVLASFLRRAVAVREERVAKLLSHRHRNLRLATIVEVGSLL